MTDLVYLACPYSHGDEAVRNRRFEIVNEMAARLMRQGLLIFSPISHGHSMAQYGLPTDWQYWERCGREFLKICRAMIVLKLPGYLESIGVGAEIQIMRDAGKPIFFIDSGDELALDWQVAEIIASLEC